MFGVEQTLANQFSADGYVLPFDALGVQSPRYTDAVALDLSMTTHTARDAHLFRGGAIALDACTAADFDVLRLSLAIKACTA